MKQFKFLSNTIQNSSLPHLEAYISIVCSIINRYRSPMVTSNVQNETIGQQMLLLLEKKKKFEQVMEFIKSYSFQHSCLLSFLSFCKEIIWSNLQQNGKRLTTWTSWILSPYYLKMLLEISHLVLPFYTEFILICKSFLLFKVFFNWNVRDLMQRKSVLPQI